MLELTLADGAAWLIEAQDSGGQNVLEQLGCAMQLSSPVPPSHRNHVLTIGFGRDGGALADPTAARAEHEAVLLKEIEQPDARARHMLQASRRLCWHAIEHGGVLLHGGLAVRGASGVVLAGASEAGKTTACGRLPASWQVLSDDTCLVVRDGVGQFWAHPWPQWSGFLNGGHGGSWEVQRAAPLAAVFFLVQDQRDSAEVLDNLTAIGTLLASMRQAWYGVYNDEDQAWARRLRSRSFENICSLAQAVTCASLRLTRHGPFWQEIERVAGLDPEE